MGFRTRTDELSAQLAKALGIDIADILPNDIPPEDQELKEAIFEQANKRAKQGKLVQALLLGYFAVYVGYYYHGKSDQMEKWKQDPLGKRYAVE